MKKTTMAAVLAMAAMTANAGYSLAYHGKLVSTGSVKISTKTAMAMEFRLYRNAEPGETAPLWGRRMPVKFDEQGQFYVELNDAAGTSVERASYANLCEAIASAGGGDVYISLTPAGHGEILPRKRLGGIHRAERAGCASKAGRVEAPLLRASSMRVGNLSVKGALSITNSFISGGAKIANTVNDPSYVLGATGGTVLFSDTFSNWRRYYSSTSNFGSKPARVDVILAFKAGSGHGVCSIPLVRGTPTSEFPDSVFYQFSFLSGNFSPFF